MAQSQRLQSVPVGAVSPSAPARAGLSTEAAPKTVIFPEAVLHAPMATEQTTGHYTDMNLFRVSCLCGRRGIWYREESLAMDAHGRHVERAAEGVR